MRATTDNLLGSSKLLIPMATYQTLNQSHLVMSTENEEKKRQLPTVTLEESYQLCRASVRRHLGQYLFAMSNLPFDEQRHLHAVLAFMLRCQQLSDINLGRAARMELLEETREDLRNNLMDEESTSEFRALVDTFRKFEIPQQYIHDMVSAADMCVRLERFETFDHWLQFGCRLGGSTMLATTQVFDTRGNNIESTAIQCGQAIQLTYLLGTICCDLRRLEFFMPARDIEEYSIDLDRIIPSNPDESVIRLIQMQVSRIESLFREGGKIVNHLALDGQRVMRSVISVSWNQLMKIKQEPRHFLTQKPELSNWERLQFRAKHLLGLEGGAEVLPVKSDEHH